MSSDSSRQAYVPPIPDHILDHLSPKLQERVIQERIQKRQGIKILAPKQILQGLLKLLLAQVKYGSKSENLLKKI